MEFIKGFVTTLITTLIFIAAVEMIIPENSTKKYLKFVLGLILTAVILNPILKILVTGEVSITNKIDEFIKSDADIQSLKKDDKNTDDINRKSFEENLNRNVENLIENKFDDINCTSKIESFVDFEKLEYKINKVDIFIVENNEDKIEKVEKIDINKEMSDKENINSKYENIIGFISEELEVDKKIINIYNEEKEGN